MKDRKSATYKDLQNQLHNILNSLEQESASLDDVASLLKDGFETIDALKARLTEAEAQIENIISLRHNTTTALSENTDGETR
ncbi:MAG: exodeoxyribonuclease VII small subunit [Proteobacteria bacterium]|nr:exodeoxyribonuclease VII small subunit [Pseudomonadota bacterium]